MTMVEPVVSKLVVISGVLTGQVFPLDAEEITLGRDADNQVCVPDLALSRRHCAFSREPAGWRVRDLGSSNGTFVNGVQVQTQLLAEGDHVAAGESVVLYVHGASVAPSAIDLDEQESLPTIRLAPEDAGYLQPNAPGAAERRRSEHGLRALLAISNIMNSIRDEAQLRRELLDLLFEAVPAEEGAILQRGSGEQLVVQAARPARGQASVHVSAATVRRAMREGTAILCAEAASSDAPASAHRSLSNCAPSHMAVPIGVRGRVLGAIYLASAPGSALTEDHLQLVTAVGQMSAISLENVRQIAALERETDRLQADLHGAHQMIGTSGPLQQVHARIAKVARVDTTVLITGETGTGKELAARAIHLNSSRARRAFVAINCAALTETLLESELFGHERGAFTNAVALKKGKVELADSGTLFLDEVGELAPVLQTKLLRVLQEREFERVGGTRPIKVDVRVMSATNRDLAAEVTAGRFRPDLYFRLNVVTIHLPPLRERRDDVPLLAEHFVSIHARKADRRVIGISPAAAQCMLAYEWPGNVRELENAIERAIVLGSTDQILLEDLPDTLLDAAPQSGTPNGQLHAQVLDAKRRAVIAAFRKADGSYTEAAKLLGVHPNYLHRLIRHLGIKGTLENAEP